MPFLLSNPAGLWALLALPVILAIHFLQERSRKVRTSTLFLLDRVKPESVGGARFERLRSSVPLWLQLLAALLIAWMLSEPRWVRTDSRQTIVIVLDSSVSMSAFKDETRSALASELGQWAKHAKHTQWHMVESDVRKPTLYAGAELSGLLDAFKSWEPLLGTHRPEDALLAARGLVKDGSGIVIFVTDRKTNVPSDIAVLAAGEFIENTGFAGVTISEEKGITHWHALVRNYGQQTQQRTWWIDDGQSTAAPKQTLTIAAAQTLTLEGTIPEGAERGTLVLAGDRFSWDDRLPIIRPKARTVRVDLRIGGKMGEMLKKMLAALDGVELSSSAASPADLTISELGTASETDAIQLPATGEENAPLDGTFTVAENHALTNDLNWMGLLTAKPLALTLSDGDETLLWKGDHPLAMLRPSQNATGRTIRRLLINWDFEKSNAARVPAVLVMLQRFVEQVRMRKDEPWAGNFEISQRIEVQGAGYTIQVPDKKPTPFDGRASGHPGFFELQKNNKTFISGAAHFADTREADFHESSSMNTVSQRRWEAALKQSEVDPLTPLWVLAVLACLIGSWAWRGSRQEGSGFRVQVLDLKSHAHSLKS
jgi:hypothetical protein